MLVGMFQTQWERGDASFFTNTVVDVNVHSKENMVSTTVPFGVIQFSGPGCIRLHR